MCVRRRLLRSTKDSSQTGRLIARGLGVDVMRLRIESRDGVLVNDYRICDGCVQVRSLDPSGEPVFGELGRWRPLDGSDIALHHALGTPVSNWLRVRVGTAPSALNRAA